MRPRFFVGVLYSGETQYESCLKSILCQSDVEVEINTISDFPNKEAHDTLYQSFMARAADFDYFVKVDADMVIERNTLFREFHHCFLQQPDVQAITAPVWDFFTHQMIIGMHSYRSSVRWVPSNEMVFVDDSPLPNEQHTVAKELAPAAVHCGDPSVFQAFYFGVHKGMKVRASLENLHTREGQLLFHWENAEKTWNHYLNCGDRRLLIASIGCELAMAGSFETHDLNRDGEKLSREASKWEKTTDEAILKTLRRLRLKNRLGLSSSSRLEVLRDGFPRFVTRRILPQKIRTLIRGVLNQVTRNSQGIEKT